MDIGPGTRLDTYEILTPLGSGGMGEVWLARDLRLDRKVAVKVLPPRVSNDPDRIARFRHEARAASALNHPNVCTIHSLGNAEDGRLFIGMEYIEGRTLRDRLGAAPLAIREALEISAQIAAALAAAHAAGVIHRDVKPENVMVRSDGLVKVLDFGLAKLDPAVAAFEVAASTRTALHSDDPVAGTMAYMSPEQARGESLDARTDLFSLGAVLYEMVAGRAPFTGNSPALVHDGILNRTPASPNSLNPHVPSRLEDVILKALEKDRDLRYQTAVDLRADLIRLTRGSDAEGTLTRSASSAPVRTGLQHHTSRYVGIGCLLFLVTILGFWIVRVGLQRPELQEIQLTTNSSENPVNAAAISPDGKHIAYADLTGIHLRANDSGETHTIAAPDIGDITRVAWFPDGSKLLVSGIAKGQEPRAAIWFLSLVGGSLRKLRDGGLDASIASDGSKIAYVGAERKQIWVMGANGEEPQPLVTGSADEAFFYPSWQNGGLGYGRVSKAHISAEFRDAQGRTTVVFSDPGLRAGILLPDRRWLYSVLAEPTLNRAASLWESHADLRTGAVKNRRLLREWPGSVVLSDFTATADGNQIVLLKQTLQRDVYVADLMPDGTPAHPRRVTLDDSDDFATNWMPDGRTIFFTSDRNGSQDIFKQALDSRVSEVIVSGPDDESGPTAVSPDGTWLYYMVMPKKWRTTPTIGNLVMRTPASGGVREKIGDEPREYKVLCARAPSTLCVLVEREGGDLSVYALDSQNARGRKITSTKAESYVRSEIAPDGSRVAVLMPWASRIRVLPLNGELPRDVVVAGWPLDLSQVFWSADNAGWYVSSTSTQDPRTVLLHVDLNGRVRVVWQQNVRGTTSAIPSPDGRHIAFTHTSTISNVWMVKRFQ